jgi:hypothetical protein
MPDQDSLNASFGRIGGTGKSLGDRMVALTQSRSSALSIVSFFVDRSALISDSGKNRFLHCERLFDKGLGRGCIGVWF